MRKISGGSPDLTATYGGPIQNTTAFSYTNSNTVANSKVIWIQRTYKS